MGISSERCLKAEWIVIVTIINTSTRRLEDIKSLSVSLHEGKHTQQRQESSTYCHIAEYGYNERNLRIYRSYIEISTYGNEIL